MKTLKLKFNELFGIRQLLNQEYSQGGLTLDSLRNAQKILDKISVNVEWASKPDKDGKIMATGGAEAKAIELRQVIATDSEGKQQSQLAWNPAKDKGRDVEFADDEVKLLKELVKEKSEKKQVSLNDAWLVELDEKLND